MDKTDLQDELERLHPASFGWALWCCDHRRDESEEVLQTAYLKVLEGVNRFEGSEALRSWFFSVVRRRPWEHRLPLWGLVLVVGWGVASGKSPAGPSPSG